LLQASMPSGTGGGGAASQVAAQQEARARMAHTFFMIRVSLYLKGLVSRFFLACRKMYQELRRSVSAAKADAWCRPGRPRCRRLDMRFSATSLCIPGCSFARSLAGRRIAGKPGCPKPRRPVAASPGTCAHVAGAR